MMDFQNALKIFEFEGKKVRVVEKDGQPWWVAKDVCDVLGLTNPTESIKSLDEDEKMGLRNSEVASLLGLNTNFQLLDTNPTISLFFWHEIMPSRVQESLSC
ncbi:MAG: Bro-N domain-containing protein [Synergistaceae bacterium]|jgi:prophage antirepressor-like protein|nr:Bro-N domain-containing protein [Synergistaceae bacterium]